MKRFLSVVLCFVFAFEFVGCKENTSGKNGHSVDVEYYANLGQISDVDYKLGDSVSSVKEVLEKNVDEDGDTAYFDYESGEYTVMTDGTVCCCYKTDDSSAGITHIVKYGDAYGFSVGTVSTQVRDTMSEAGFDSEERDARPGELFFLPSGADTSVLEYDFDKATVLFIFQQNALSAAVIY